MGQALSVSGSFWQVYKTLSQKAECPVEVWVYLACTMFLLGRYKEAEEAASKGEHLATLLWMMTDSKSQMEPLRDPSISAPPVTKVATWLKIAF